MSNERITIGVDVAATPEQAWWALTQGAAIVVWNHASDDWHCPAASGDLRVGGNFSQTLAAKDGSMSFEMTGVYTEVEPGARLAYTMADGRGVEVTLTALPEGRTRVTETFDAEATNPIEMQRAGWQAILDNYGAYTNAYAQAAD